MKWILKHRYLSGFATLIFASVLFRLFPGLSAQWTDSVIRPFNLSVHRFTSRIGFPIFEIICILIPAFLAAGLIRATRATIVLKTSVPLRGWLNTPAHVILAVSSIYVFLWYPAYWNGTDYGATLPDIARIEWLCTDLISDLNTVELDFSAPALILEGAPAVSGATGVSVKAARYPEWMRLMHIAGLYAPWTGEAIVNTTVYPATLPFTAVHELMHLFGIADEGSANIAAWEACKAKGGEFYASARLWVLRYAMEMVDNAHPEAIPGLYQQMSPRLFSVFSNMNGKSASGDRGAGMLLAALGLSRTASSYADVVGYVINNGI